MTRRIIYAWLVREIRRLNIVERVVGCGQARVFDKDGKQFSVGLNDDKIRCLEDKNRFPFDWKTSFFADQDGKETCSRIEFKQIRSSCFLSALYHHFLPLGERDITVITE